MEDQKTENQEKDQEKEKQKEENNKSKFECNICFDDVREPVVTRCGHLFCWSCILSWMNRNNNQCPICQAGISKQNVIPLYGHGQNQTDPRNNPEEPRPKGERPTTQRRPNSFFRGYDSRISVSFGSFPLSFILPIGFGSGTSASSIFNIFGTDEATRDMMPEQRRAYTHSLFFFVAGTLMIAYLLLCV